MALKGTSQDQSKFFFNFLIFIYKCPHRQCSQSLTVIGGIHVPHRFLYLYRGTVSTHQSQYLYILAVI